MGSAIPASIQNRLPDGLEAKHVVGHRKGASPLSSLVLSGVLLAGICGVVGSLGPDRLTDDNDDVRLDVEMPTIVRNGEILETRISIAPHRRIHQLVLGISAPLWDGVTVNTMIPEASEETYSDNFYRFAYGEAEPDEILVVKIDGQINPHVFGNNHGEIAVFDGTVKLQSLPLTLAVRP